MYIRGCIRACINVAQGMEMQFELGEMMLIQGIKRYETA